jgi:hypothetical protein
MGILDVLPQSAIVTAAPDEILRNDRNAFVTIIRTCAQCP